MRARRKIFPSSVRWNISEQLDIVCECCVSQIIKQYFILSAKSNYPIFIILILNVKLSR